ncbi:MAG TPA: TetR/AcrR family transcriptional regulator [Rhodocyclaceae bacterium]|nr:TetR/AcrR family transcriptional regulator [Rhodocyclaceae bacterium]
MSALRPSRPAKPADDGGAVGMREQLRSFKRERILEVAGQLFYERGYHGTSLDALAERLGVSKPFIYAYYRNKTELLIEIYTRVVQLSLDCVAAARAEGETPVAQIVAFARRFADLTVREQAVVAVFFQEVSSIPDEHVAAINRLKKSFDDALTALIKDGIAAGAFDVGDARMAALAMTGMISWIYTWYRSSGRLKPDELCGIMAEYAMRIVGGHGCDRE